MFPRLLKALHLALLVGALSAGHAQAQWGRDLSPPHAELKLASALSLAPRQVALARLVPLGPYQLDPQLQPGPPVTPPTEQRQARLLVTMGSGMLAGAALHIALMSQVSCDGVPKMKVSYAVGALVGSVGLGLTIAGAKRLAPRKQRRPTSPARKFGLVVLALASLTASELLMLMASVGDLMCQD